MHSDMAPRAANVSARGLALDLLLLELADHPRELVVLGIEIGDRQAEDRGESLEGLQVGLVNAGLVAVHAGAGDEIVEARLHAQAALGDPVGLAGLAQPPAEDW